MGYKDPTPTIIEDGPWRRMADNIAPTARKKGALRYAQNVYPVSGDAGDSYIGRPGYTVIGAQLGAVGARTVQGVFQYKKKDGTKHRIAIVGGLFYTLNWATRTWTEVLTTAQLTAAAVTLSTTARVAFLNFANVVVISDGVNMPWSWDGTSGAGITKLTNAPVFYGTLTMYYDRLFGRKASDPSTFVWSEPSQPNTGYEAGGFANAWTMVQTDASAIQFVVGTNDALNAFRARSATAATGRPDANFQSQSTREGVAETEGSSSPWGYVQTERALVFLDSDLHPQMTRAGGTLVPLWEDIYQTLRALPRSGAVTAIAVNYTPANLFLFAVCDVLSPTEPNVILVYDATPDVPVAVAIWRGFTMTALAMVDDGSDVPTLLHGYNGYIYEHGSPEGVIWDDSGVPIEHIVETQGLGLDLKGERYYDRVDISLETAETMTFEVYAETPRGRAAAQTLTVLGGSARFDVDVFDSGRFFRSTLDIHADAGLDAEGRSIIVGIRHQRLGEQFSVNALAVTAFPSGSDPSVP